MEEDKIIVDNIEEEATSDGVLVLRVTLKKGKQSYVRGARYVDYMDPQKKKSIFRSWKRDIAKIEAEKAINKDEVAANIKKLKGETLPDE